jgi:hypothetical protein
VEQVCRKTGNNKIKKIAAFAIFGPLRVGFQLLDRCASDFNRYALDFVRYALDFICYALVLVRYALDSVRYALALNLKHLEENYFFWNTNFFLFVYFAPAFWT